MKIGAHISTAKPFSDSITRAREIGCECMQIFSNPPQRWNPVPLSESEVSRFRKLNEEVKIDPIIIHGIYLVNLASSNPFYYEASIKSLTDDMIKAAALGAHGVNFHIGSTKGAEFEEVLPKVVEAMKKILSDSPEGPFLIIENSAGAGNVIGDTIEEIAKVVNELNSDRVKVLFDTAHAFESGYDLKDPTEIDNFINKIDSLVGLDKLVGFHLNDSKTILNSKRDRHADIGHGEIGLEAFRYLINDSRLTDKCGILETPQDIDTWETQIKLLKSMKKI